MVSQKPAALPPAPSTAQLPDVASEQELTPLESATRAGSSEPLLAPGICLRCAAGEKKEGVCAI